MTNHIWAHLEKGMWNGAALLGEEKVRRLQSLSLWPRPESLPHPPPCPTSNSTLVTRLKIDVGKAAHEVQRCLRNR